MAYKTGDNLMRFRLHLWPIDADPILYTIKQGSKLCHGWPTWRQIRVYFEVLCLPEAVTSLHHNTLLLLLLLVVVLLMMLLLLMLLLMVLLVFRQRRWRRGRRRRGGHRRVHVYKVVQVIHFPGGVAPRLAGQPLEAGRWPVDAVQEQVRGGGLMLQPGTNTIKLILP